MLGNFRIARLCNTIFGFNPHDAIIGEWIKWWLTDSNIGVKKRRRIINPAIGMAKYGKKFTVADVLFAEESPRDSGFYRVVGVAEIENNESSLLRKLNNLTYYEEYETVWEDKKFPDLKFALLCAKVYAYCQDGTVILDNESLIEKLKNRMRKYSKQSNMCWILYLLQCMKARDDYVFAVRNYQPNTDMFWYNYSFCGSEFSTYYKGKQTQQEQFVMKKGLLEE